MSGNQLIELQVNRERLLVLRSLNQKHHQERDDRGAGVDDQLPGFAVFQPRPERTPC
jgi:hypothetical protein